MLGVQPAFVRRLDSEAVVQPARSDGGQRRYSRAEIATVQQVAQMADDGMSLPGIRRILVLEAEVLRLQQEIARLERAVVRASGGELAASAELAAGGYRSPHALGAGSSR